MGCVSCLVIFMCLFFTVANGTILNKVKGLTVDSYAAIYGDDTERILKEGIKNKKILCIGSHKGQKIEWYNPEGKLVKQDSSNSLVDITDLGSSRHSLALVFTSTRASDSGVWECRSGDETKKVPLCIMDPANGTAEDLTVDEQRSITLRCKFEGNPEPRIEWYRKEKLIVDTDDGEKFFISTKYSRHDYEGQLTIKSVCAEDQDEYTCKGIQEHPEYLDLDHCIYITTVNISLYVNHAPRYLDQNFMNNLAEFYVFAQDDEPIILTCNPSAYPEPEFRWFNVTGNSKTEYKHFDVSPDGKNSTLPLVANSASYGSKFICKAKNDYGELDTTFYVVKKQKPSKLSATSEFVARQLKLYFNITWEGDIVYPIDGFDIQYFEKVTIGEPKQWQWKHANTVQHQDSRFNHLESLVPLGDLDINKEYWVRLRAYNDLGKADWSSHILASTAYDAQTAGISGPLLGAIVTVAIIVFAGGCIIIIKRL